MLVTARSAELSVLSYLLIVKRVRGDRTTANRQSRIVEAMRKPRPTTAATTTKCNKPEVRHGESVLYRIRDRRSVDQGQEAPLRPLPVGAVLVAEFLGEKFFFGTDPRDDGHTDRRG